MSPFKEAPEVEVVAMETLTKATTISDPSSMLVTEYEYEADDSSSVMHSHWEHGDLTEAFKNENRTATECLQACCRVLSKLIGDRCVIIAGINIRNLYQDCLYWEQEQFKVEEL